MKICANARAHARERYNTNAAVAAAVANASMTDVVTESARTPHVQIYK